MSASEFEIIERFFTWPATRQEEILLGVGDDAAEIKPAKDCRLLVDVGQIREGKDFQPQDDAASVGHRLLAAAMARVAARGALPLAFTLALSMPQADESWLTAFSGGLAALARRYDIALIGGDTTRGPRAAVLHLHGNVRTDTLVTDNGAGVGDLIYVSGTFGDAALALLHLAGELQLPARERDAAFQALRFPEPPVASVTSIAGLASAAAAVDDGLSQSLERLLGESGCGATVQVQRLPLGTALQQNLQRAGGWSIPWNGPSPAQLCFTIPPAAQARFERRNAALSRPCTWIGLVERNSGLRAQLDDGSAV